MLSQAKRHTRSLLRLILPAILAVLLIGLIVPFIEIGGLHTKIQNALEAALGRKVDLGKVHLTLFSGPGFSIDQVTIHEDPRYGLEPFAYVPTLEARVRLDKLLFGELRFSSLRLEDASLNLVKRNDGTWNVVELVDRLSGPRRMPLNLFPAVELSDSRIDFKFGTRKTTLYIADSDLAVYPERSGKLYVQFSGSPARTDRAGNGFGHFRGKAVWYMSPRSHSSNQLEAEVNLEPSNLSELTTLFEGHDIGVHGTVSSHVRIEGPSTALRIAGDLHLEDVHRWDLLPASGEDWWIHYRGGVDLTANRFELETIPSRSGEPTPVALQVRVNDFLTRPAWSIFATLKEAPVEDLLPLGRRMGLALPQDLAMKGSLNGVVGYSNRSGLGGAVSISNIVAGMPDVPPLHAASVSVTLFPDHIHFDPAVIESSRNGNLQAGGDYYLSTRRTVASLKAQEFPLDDLKSTLQAWVGGLPAAASLTHGLVTGQCLYVHESPEFGAENLPASWSGQFQVVNSTLEAPGLAFPLKRFTAHLAFDESGLNVNHFSATLGHQIVNGSYRYRTAAKRTEHVHLEMPSANLSEIEAALDPTLEAQNLLARLRFTRRAIPSWLAARNLEGDLTVDRFSIGQTELGPLSSHFVWQGTNLQFTSAQVNLPEGLIRGHGSVNLASYTPRCRFAAKITGYPWAGGLLNGDGELETTGVSEDSLRNLHATGKFTADGVSFSDDAEFSRISGLFDFSFADNTPKLQISEMQASRDGEDWDGDAASDADGRLVINLEHEGQQLHLVGTLVPENSPGRQSLTSSTAVQ